jgi:hypothetical protein
LALNSVSMKLLALLGKGAMGEVYRARN